MKKINFFWPSEGYLPSSLFKHFTYLGEVANYCREFSDVNIFDLSVESKKRNEVIDLMGKSDFILIPLEVYNIKQGINLAKLSKQTSEALVVAYGSVASMNPDILSPYFDVILKKDSWEKGIKKMITQREEFNKSVQNKVYDFFEPLLPNEWAHPALDLLPIREYLKISPNQLELRVQRGCGYNCSFCAEHFRIPNKNVYHRSPESISSFLDKNPGFRFYIDAATFTLDRDWSLEVCKELSNLSPKRLWRTVTRIDRLDEELIKEMSKSGCYKIGFGVETLDLNLQKRIGKIVDKESIEKKSKIMKDNGIIPRAFFILGLPDQTKEDIEKINEFVNKIGIEHRWKEYLPIETVPFIKSLEGFEIFERTKFINHTIKGVSNKEYFDLLKIER